MGSVCWKKSLYFVANLRGTSQYWAQRARKLRALIHFKINQGCGLPSFFSTGSCAEFHFRPLHRLISLFLNSPICKSKDLNDKTQLYEALQENTHIVAYYFDLRTHSYFKQVMGPVFWVDTYWYRQEFAKTRGMIHWHDLCWQSDKQPHPLLFEAVNEGLSNAECAEKVATWAASTFGMIASHPDGKDGSGQPLKTLWPPPEGTTPPPPEEKNPLLQLLMDVSSTQASLSEDHLLFTNRFNLHRCSDYCLTITNKSKPNTKLCRMEFPNLLRDFSDTIHDRNKSTGLEMPRDHPMLVQHSIIHTQAW